MAGGCRRSKDAPTPVPATPARAPSVIAGLDPAIPIGFGPMASRDGRSRPAMTRANLLRAPHLRDHRLDMSDRRLRHDAVAEVEDVRAAARRREDARRRRWSSASPPATSASGSRLPCVGELRRELAESSVRVERPVERQRVAKAGLGERGQVGRRRRGRTRSPGACGRARLQALARSAGSDRARAARTAAGGRRRAEALEDLHRLRARIDLRRQIGDRGRDEPVDERRMKAGSR